MDAGGLRAFAASCPPCARCRNSSRIPPEHKLLQAFVLRKSLCRKTAQSRSSRKASIVVATNAAVADDAATVVLGVWWLRFRDMGSLVRSSVSSFSQGALLQAKAKTISHGDESPGALDTVVTKRWRCEDVGTSMETRTTSGRLASTSGSRPNGSRRFNRNMDGAEIESLEILARQETSVVNAQNALPHRQARFKPSLSKKCIPAPGIRSSEGVEEIGTRSNAASLQGQSSQSTVTNGGNCRSLSDASTSTTAVIEHVIDVAGKTILGMDHTSGAVGCTIGLNVTIGAVDYFPSASTSLENGILSDQEDRLNLSTNLNKVSAWEEEAPAQLASGIVNPNSISEAKKSSMESIQKQLSSLTGRKGMRERGGLLGKAIVRRDLIQLPDNIEAVLPVNPKKDPAEYLFLYRKLLGAGRLQDCVAILESIDEYSILNMDKVNPHEFYSACKRRRALKEAFRFSRLVGRKSLRNYNMLLSVCAQSQDASAACRVLEMVRNAGLQADCIFYTTLISACAKAGRIDLMFKFLNEMETEGIDANVQTFGAMIDGCARAGDVPKAFGIYKKMLNQNVKPDRVIFNTLITACGRAGALLRAFEVLADMRDEPDPVALDHFTYGALIAACARAGEVERAFEVYKRMRSSKVAGTAECYTAAVHACRQKGYLKFALSIYEDMQKDGVLPDEVFFCALIDVAGHARKLDTAFAILREMKSTGISPGPSSYNTLMVVCSNVGNAEGAMHVYEEIKDLGLKLTVSTLNALVASLCAGRQLDCALTVLQEFRIAGVMPNKDTYSILLAACEREDQASIALKLYNHSKDDFLQPTLKMCNSILDLCIRRIETGALPPHDPRFLNIHTNEDDVVLHQYWTSQGLVVYNDLISAGLIPTLGIISQVLGCLRVSAISSQHILYTQRSANSFRNSEIPTTISVEDACGMYLPRALTLYEDATTLGVIRIVNYAAVPISVDMRNVPVYAGEVGMLTLLKDLKHRHDKGLYLNSVKLIFSVELKEAFTARGGFRRIQVPSRTGEAVMTLLRKLRIKYEGHESSGDVTISTSAIRNWLRISQSAPQKARNLQAVETNSLSCKAGSLAASVSRSKRRLSHYCLRAALENAPVV